jgi:hypothetical protein
MDGRETSMKAKDLKAVQRMYNALMAIGCVDNFNSPQWNLNRCHEISNACLKEMNMEHTQLIAEAIGLEGKRG